MSSNFLIWS